jgi:2-dehydro-3-deoxyphosphogluconate aldolase/(4S)-4-hydroxy-2-oxoglutarate aldolase
MFCSSAKAARGFVYSLFLNKYYKKQKESDHMVPKEEALKAILDVGIVAIVRLDSSSQLQAAAEAIQAGGIRAIEFTMTTPGALDMLKEAATNLNEDTVLGAGTVLAGAKFIVAPNLNLDVIAIAHRYSIAVIPGALTPTEILTAWEAGADLVKIFPASIGGPEMIKALRGPLPHIKMIPTGGVDLHTAAAFIKAGSDAVAVGGNLVDKEVIKRGEFDKITNLAKQYVEIVFQARRAK